MRIHFFLIVIAALARPASAVVPEQLLRDIEQAKGEQNDCLASFLYQEAYSRCAAEGCSAGVSYLRGAAETADAANDINLALKLYRQHLDTFPESGEADFIQGRIASLDLVAQSERSEVCRQPQVRCGNWIVSRTEECDDGNVSDGDGCSSTCRIEACGNGTLDGGEECDDSNTVDDDGCSARCAIEQDEAETADEDESPATPRRCEGPCPWPLRSPYYAIVGAEGRAG